MAASPGKALPGQITQLSFTCRVGSSVPCNVWCNLCTCVASINIAQSVRLCLEAFRPAKQTQVEGRYLVQGARYRAARSAPRPIYVCCSGVKQNVNTYPGCRLWRGAVDFAFCGTGAEERRCGRTDVGHTSTGARCEASNTQGVRFLRSQDCPGRWPTRSIETGICNSANEPSPSKGGVADGVYWGAGFATRWSDPLVTNSSSLSR